jgi:large subunit ribosomal protein L16
MISPANIKYRKPHRLRFSGVASCGTSVSFGDYGLRSIGCFLITSRQIEIGRRVITRYVRRNGKVWIRVFPDKSITQRPRETRIGSGKGRVRYYATLVYPGTILFELCGITSTKVCQIARVLTSKFPVQIRVASLEK